MKEIRENDAKDLLCPHLMLPIEVAAGIWIVANLKADGTVPNKARCLTGECIYWEKNVVINKRGEKIKMGRCVHT
jgi:hypothetical protein